MLVFASRAPAKVANGVSNAANWLRSKHFLQSRAPIIAKPWPATTHTDWYATVARLIRPISGLRFPIPAFSGRATPTAGTLDFPQAKTDFRFWSDNAPIITVKFGVAHLRCGPKEFRLVRITMVR